jgi:hypothetical protein
MWTYFPSERLRCWQNFRLSLNKVDLLSAMQETNHLWSFCPYQKYYLTVDQVDFWPDPWELLYENTYCDLARALGIVYTLYLTEHRPDLEIRVYNEPITKTQYNLVFIDKGKYVLNYEHDKIVNKKHVDPSLKLIKKITTADLKLDRIQ